MRKLIAIFMLGLSPFLAASDLKIENGRVVQELSNYEKTYESDVYHFYIRTDIKQIGSNQFLVHTMVEYVLPDGVEYAELGYSVKRIYNYGMLDCNRRVFNLVSDIFTDETNKIVYSEVYELGEFVAELMNTNTARYTVYKKVCVNTL
jgi:hypothetical protein